MSECTHKERPQKKKSEECLSLPRCTVCFAGRKLPVTCLLSEATTCRPPDLPQH
ncbi:hypothetical protein PR003_g12175 [Phytophthora rubi]|uniref:Uncharacterized protein n=1 Tax=Phytophthora rubi TaxID=129364 RepID=A0A6A3M292_9STRA|nr:hypothetical protein PR002_g11962 [Phytophthora rubi]KAE9337088.1 hypothetical protein PR003_g12175 [Phytophthora rubi]